MSLKFFASRKALPDLRGHTLITRLAFPTVGDQNANSCMMQPGPSLEADLFRKKALFTLGWEYLGPFNLHHSYLVSNLICHSDHQNSFANTEVFDPYKGCRVGEASHPGPGNQTKDIVFAVLNPTSIPDRHTDIVNLNADCISLVETSATSSVQVEFSKFLKSTEYHISWGPPVPSQRQLNNPFLHDNAKRGAALGTASLQRIPHRTPRIPLPTWLEETLRVSQQILVIGHVEVLLVTAYFVAGKTHEAKSKSDYLLAEIYQVCASTNLPFLVAADFNNPVRDFPAYRAFQSIRCQEAFHLASMKLDKQLPPTCRNSTRNDSFIIHEALVPWIQDIWVGEANVFPDHSPLFIRFRVPGTQRMLRNWFMPQSWGDIPLKPEVFARHYTRTSRQFLLDDDLSTEARINAAFESWSKGIERAVQGTLREQHIQDPLRYPRPNLGKKYFGRGTPTKYVTHVAPRTVKIDTTHAYEPPTEITSCKARQKVRQVRRIASLLQHLKKLRPQCENPVLKQQLQQEWNVIQKAQGFGRSWAAWILSFEFVTHIPVDTPSADWLQEVLQLTKFESDAYARQESHLRRHHKRHSIAYALSHTNKAQAYKYIKNKDQKFLHDIPVTHQSEATLCRSSKGQTVLHLQKRLPVQIGSRVHFGECTAEVRSIQNTRMALCKLQGHVPAKALLSYNTHAYTIEPMSEAFHRYWAQFWQRDSMHDQESDEPWADLFRRLEDIIPPQTPLQIKYDCPHVLWDTIHRLKPYKAIGEDGWHAEELQALTWDMVVDLSKILSKTWSYGHTAQHMQARTLLFAKKPQPESISDGRPITILGYLARLTSKLIADQVLKQWTSTWPSEISGGLPHRSARDLSLIQMLKIEEARTHRTAWCGWTMDLVKAFNLIPRRVVRYILRLLGIPVFVSDFWFKSLRRLTRVLQCGRAIGPAAISTTGLPEGDSMSVVGMLALSFVFHHAIKSPQIYPYTYADNWSFMSTSERETFRTMITILNLVHDLRMRIDLDKSWGWATSKPLRQFWHDASQIMLQPNFRFKIKNHVQDLGCMIAYTNQVVLGPLRDKIDNAMAKCNRLRKLNLSLEERAEKIQTAIWPATFYGALGMTIGEKHFTNLRRAATNVLVGDHKQASSHVALHFLSHRVQDPMLYVISDMFTTLRRLFVYHPSLANNFVQSLRRYSGQAHGPATALAAYIHRLDWEVTPGATLLGPGGLRINIQTATSKAIKKELRIAWDWHCHNEISHRKGVPPTPFDSWTANKILEHFTDRQRRILAITITAGWQSNGVIAQWSATQSPECPFCKQFDTHKHFLLECPAFQHIRKQHPKAIQHLQMHTYLCWFPLPVHSSELALIRQAMHLRYQTVHIDTQINVHNGDVFYTDGSCQNPTSPYAARAAWAVVHRSRSSSTLENKYQVLATGHCPGKQTINRAELFALVISAEQANLSDDTSQVSFYTDSQFVVNVISHIEEGTILESPHKRDHWDLITQLCKVWICHRFHVFKIRSHQKLEDAHSSEEEYHILGNMFADEAAVRTCAADLPDFLQQCEHLRAHYQTQRQNIYEIYKYILDLSCERMTTLDEIATENKKTMNAADQQTEAGQQSTILTPSFSSKLAELRDWPSATNLFTLPAEPHRVVFWSCPWGCNHARLVWTFCTVLKWPAETAAPVPKDPGISWTELAVSFMLWAGRSLPIRVANKASQEILEYDDPKTSLQPVKLKSVRVLAETFRLIIKHLQTFSRCKIVPAYKQQGTSSLTRLGFSRYHESGISRHPELPNAAETYQYLKDLVLTIPHNPPFHNEILPLPIVPRDDRPPWPNWPEVSMSKREKFTQHIRYYLFRKKNFDLVVHPGPN